MKNNIGSAYLIPVSIAEDEHQQLSLAALGHLKNIKYWCTENGKTFRHFLKKVHPEINLNERIYLEYDKHNGAFDLKEINKIIDKGHNIGIVSESGMPGVADPGNFLVRDLQRRKVKIIPVSGPNSLLMALMASGLNGQRFSFHGYLPIEASARSNKLKDLESTAQKEKSAEIFMETPYRNSALIQAALKSLNDNTLFCIAADISGPREFIKTMTISQWQNFKLPDLQKIPAVFIIGKA